MEQNATKSINTSWLQHLFATHREALLRYDPPSLKEARDQAMASFVNQGFPSKSQETWRHTDIAQALNKPYDYPLQVPEVTDKQKVFRCNIPHMDTALIGELNGWFVSQEVPLMELGNGVIIGSLLEATKKFPHLVERHLGKHAQPDHHPFTALNSVFATDGTFIYIPDDISSEKVIQLVNVIQHPGSIFIQSRNLIILGKNAKLTLVQCDDSYDHEPSFSNVVTEVVLDEGATLDHYKLQNLNNEATLINASWFDLKKDARLKTQNIAFNGGLLRNNVFVRMNGKGASADVEGLYLMDRRQHIDNYVFVDHASPDCLSNTLFKGVLDEHASGVFNGHVLVEQDAQRTNAYQNNRNLLLTDNARINSQPFLEIYNDDVKCSHGSTTGQLDEEAMFYMQQRGISKENARMLLMYAFADEVVSKIAIEPLRHRIEDMVKKRLQGELQICEQCVLHCTTPEHPIDFKIDMSKI
jgi:Fe-S cluster assembly protein SufD